MVAVLIASSIGHTKWGPKHRQIFQISKKKTRHRFRRRRHDTSFKKKRGHSNPGPQHQLKRTDHLAPSSCDPDWLSWAWGVLGSTLLAMISKDEKRLTGRVARVAGSIPRALGGRGGLGGGAWQVPGPRNSCGCAYESVGDSY
jgi:hypothetical protein